ncbi:MAG: Na/Pi cotransporter family protein [Lachnospiraceae bacterium]|jgi:phosphate:Na+ symporter|nr:Na/Pi cotransporter family protein [Lachnospiraceae bacterium]
MDFFDLLSMIGGLALFLYGMNLMGDGLAKASGGRMESILEKLTGNSVKAVLLGAGVTAVIQSSSATTVMVVGFVNSGIMRLEQAVGVIMGANVGTTITSWILSLTGIESSSFLVRLLKPTSFSPVLAIIGVAMLLFSKKEKRQSVASILIGFAVLMFGMDTMSAAVKPLAQEPAFTGILTAFSNPVLGMLAGVVLTAVIQSSSASVGILQALCLSGAVGYNTAIPIILGQNIGTCVTAMISGVGASRNARRAALVHLYFNIIGTVVFMGVFYLLDAAFQFPFMEKPADALGIAVVHSCFNVSATLLLLPFSRGLVKLACLTTGGGVQEQSHQEDEVLQHLDPRFLNTPAYAIEQSRNVAVSMAELAERAINLAMGLVTGYDSEKAQQVLELETRVDQYEDQLGSYLVKAGSRDLSERDNHSLSVMLHCIGDFERISDHARNVQEAAQEMADKGVNFSEKALQELEVLRSAIRDILKITMRSFMDEDLELARQVEPLEEVIDALIQEIRQRHIRRLRKGSCTIELGFILTDIITNLERVSDHCSNIAVCLLEISEDEFDTHAYLEDMRREDNTEFRRQVMAYGRQYLLP